MPQPKDKDWLLLLLLSRFSRVWLCDPIDGSPPGSAVPGILQARTLEWVAISFSNAGKWKVKVKQLSCVWLFTNPWTAAFQAPQSMGFSRQEYWSRVPFPSLKDWLIGYKNKTPIYAVYKRPTSNKGTHTRLKLKGWKKVFHVNGDQKKAGLAILISDKRLWNKYHKRDKEKHYIWSKDQSKKKIKN